MNAARERVLIRTLHLVLSVPIIGFVYGPVAHIPTAAFFTRTVAIPLVVTSGLWLWLKPTILRRWRQTQPEWYVFPIGSPQPTDPKRHVTTLKTVWNNIRAKAKVKGR